MSRTAALRDSRLIIDEHSVEYAAKTLGLSRPHGERLAIS
jgi:hypothetical protein